MNVKTQYTRNENVLVARSDGSWSKAVVVSVDESKKCYVVVFHDSGAGKSVQKQISFETAMFHLKEDMGGAYTRLDKKTHRLIDEIASMSLRNKIPFLDATCKLMENSGNVPFINPVRNSYDPAVGATLEKLLQDLSTSHIDPDRTIHAISQWCEANKNTRIEPAVSSSPPHHQPDPPPKESPNDMSSVITSMFTMKEKIHELSQVGSPSEDVLQELTELKSRYNDAKLDVIKESKTGNAPEELTKELLCVIVRDGDQHDHSTDVVQALLFNCSEINFTETIQQNNLLVDCCTDGNTSFLSQLLGYSHLSESSFDAIELFSAACFSQTARIQCVKVLLNCPLVNLSGAIDDLKPVIEEYFSDITSSQKRLPKESRAGLEEVVEIFLSRPLFSDCNLKDGGSDPLSFLARTCRDGDLSLYKICIAHTKSPAQELMDPLPDGFTPFMHAIIKGQKELVAEVLSTQKLDLDKDTETGTCLGIANALQLDEITELLQTAGATVSKFHSSA